MSEEKREKVDNGIQVHLRIRPSPKPSTYFQRDDIDDLNRVIVTVPRKNEEIANNSERLQLRLFRHTGRQSHTERGLSDGRRTRSARCVGRLQLRDSRLRPNRIGQYVHHRGRPGETRRQRPHTARDRAFVQIFVLTDEKNGASYSCFASYLEMYNQSGYDPLLENGSSAFDKIPKVIMLEDEDGTFHFRNLSVHTVSPEEDVPNLVFLDDTNRATVATEMNQNSTRNRCIFTVMLQRRSPGSDAVTRSKLNTVDPAGSERVSRTSSVGQTLRDAKHINSSLFVLEMVIVALHEMEKKRKEYVHGIKISGRIFR